MNNTLEISLDGAITCRAMFGSYHTICNNFSHTFDTGVTVLQGDIDLSGWAVSYTVSNFKNKCDDFVFDGNEKAVYNGKQIGFDELTRMACYIDKRINNVGSKSIRKLIESEIKKNKFPYTALEIKEMFELDDQRSESRIEYVGNEFIRSLAAIELVRGKQFFCFPWLSDKMYKYYLPSIELVCKILTSFDKTIIIPTNNTSDINSEYKVIEVS